MAVKIALILLLSAILVSAANVLERNRNSLISLLEQVVIDPEAPYTLLRCPLIAARMQRVPFFKVSSNEFILNPNVLAEYDGHSVRRYPIYVRNPIRLPVLKHLAGLGVGSEKIVSFVSLLGREFFDVSGKEFVEHGLVLPEELWYEAISNAGDELFYYLLKQGGADSSYRIQFGPAFYSVLGFCVHVKRIEFIPALLEAGVSLCHPVSSYNRNIWSLLDTAPFLEVRHLLIHSPVFLAAFFEAWRDLSYDTDGFNIAQFDETLVEALRIHIENGSLNRSFLNQADLRGLTVLDIVATGPNEMALPRISAFLLELGVYCKYPLTAAIKFSPPETILPLIRSGTIDPNERVEGYWAEPAISLLLCSEIDFSQEIEVLLELGATLIIGNEFITNIEQLYKHLHYTKIENYSAAARHLFNLRQ